MYSSIKSLREHTQRIMYTQPETADVWHSSARDSCYQSQGRLVVTASFAARKVTVLLIILPSPAEHEGSSGLTVVQALAAAQRGTWAALGKPLYRSRLPQRGWCCRSRKVMSAMLKKQASVGAGHHTRGGYGCESQSLLFLSCIFMFCFLAVHLSKFCNQGF